MSMLKQGRVLCIGSVVTRIIAVLGDIVFGIHVIQFCGYWIFSLFIEVDKLPKVRNLSCKDLIT